MTDIDTSAEAVERLAAQCLEYGGAQSFAADVAATLRALVRERDEARALIEEMRAPYAIVAKREWQAGAEAMRDICAKTASERGAWASNDMDAESLIDRLEANGRMEMAGEVFDAIRAMPIPERPE